MSEPWADLTMLEALERVQIAAVQEQPLYVRPVSWRGQRRAIAAQIAWRQVSDGRRTWSLGGWSEIGPQFAVTYQPGAEVFERWEAVDPDAVRDGQ